MTQLTITDKLQNLNHDTEGQWLTIREWLGQHSQFLRCLKTKQLYLIFLVFLYFLPPWNLLRLPDASAKQVLKETHEHRRQDAPKRCIWSWWCVATVVHLNDAHPSQWCTGVRDSSTKGHKGNHNGQVDGFSFELLVFKHENKRLILVSYIDLNIISPKEFFVPKYKCPMLWTVYGVAQKR